MTYKDTRIYVRVTDEEKVILRNAAERAGMTMSEFIRDTSLRAAFVIQSGRIEDLEETMRLQGIVLMTRST